MSASEAKRFPLGKGKGLSPEEVTDFLTTTDALAKLGTVDAEGWPVVNPVLYEYDGEAIYVISKERAAFVHNLQRDPRVGVCIDSPVPPYRRVIIKGRAEFVEEDWRPRNRRMVQRYMGSSGDDYEAATQHLPRVVLRIVPVKMTTWDGGGIDRSFSKPTAWREPETERRRLSD